MSEIPEIKQRWFISLRVIGDESYPYVIAGYIFASSKEEAERKGVETLLESHKYVNPNTEIEVMECHLDDGE